MSEVDKMMAENRPMDEIAYEALTSDAQPSGKTYPVYTTEDGRLELRMSYDTATAYLLSEGQLSSKQELTTIEELAHMVRNLETYDAKLRRASI